MSASSNGELLFSATFVSDLSPQRKCDLLNTFWPGLRLQESEYIEPHYADFWDSINRSLDDLSGSKYQFATQHLDRLLVLITQLHKARGMTKAQILEEVKNDYTNHEDDEDILRSIELGSRLWLGIYISTKTLWHSIGTKDALDTSISWDEKDSVSELVAKSFTKKSAWVNSEDYTFDNSFTVEALRRICRLNIRWTDNLVDHLKLDGSRGDRVLSIYPYKICLINHRKYIDPSVLESALLDEAIRTLDLLFPVGDTKTADFLEEEGKHFYSIAPTDKRPTDLSDFTYWRNNLAQLLKLLNGPPETAAQTLLDTRNTSQFVTLWGAIFGVIILTILFGTLATVYSVKQYELAIKSYDLAVAVACVEHPELRWCHNEL